MDDLQREPFYLVVFQKDTIICDLLTGNSGYSFSQTGNTTSGNDGCVAETCVLVTQDSSLFSLTGQMTV